MSSSIWCALGYPPNSLWLATMRTEKYFPDHNTTLPWCLLNSKTECASASLWKIILTHALIAHILPTCIVRKIWGCVSKIQFLWHDQKHLIPKYTWCTVFEFRKLCVLTCRLQRRTVFVNTSLSLKHHSCRKTIGPVFLWWQKPIGIWVYKHHIYFHLKTFSGWRS